MRIPGEGSDELVSRENEYIVYQLLKGRSISDQVVYISPENGYKISSFRKQHSLSLYENFKWVGSIPSFFGFVLPYELAN